MISVFGGRPKLSTIFEQRIRNGGHIGATTTESTMTFLLSVVVEVFVYIKIIKGTTASVLLNHLVEMALGFL